MFNTNQWVLWGIENETKVPVNGRGIKINAHDKRNHMSYYDAVEASARTSFGLAFVFTKNDPYFFIDLDDCLIDGQWSDEAKHVASLFPGAFIEVSFSGTGLHIIGSAQNIPPHKCRLTTPNGEIELYTDGRFVAFTGTQATGDPDSDHTAALHAFIDRYFKADPPAPRVETEIGNSLSDEQLLEKALASNSAASIFGDKCTFADLWFADADALARAFPASNGRPYDASRADASLAQRLAFWTGRDAVRIERLMRQSALYRPKWDREDYLPTRTIARAVANQVEAYIERKSAPKTQAANDTPVIMRSTGLQFMTADMQVEYFKGCVYILDVHKVLIPTGDLLKTEQFNAQYGGYVFQLDSINNKTTKKAWEAFTESQCVRFPKVHSVCFRPSLPPGNIIEEAGRRYVNTYVPIDTRRQAGDATPFLNHLNKLLPNELDRRILLSYLAACVQYKGVKFQWTPMIQGAEGNGKTLLTRCVMYAVGEKYSHMPPANEISEKYNDWLFFKLVIGIEDIYVPENKREVMEVLKPMLTNERLAMRAMYAGQIMGDNVANFIINSNYKDAVKKHASGRRFAIFYTAQQSEEDIRRDGMGDGYFPELYNWLRSGGYSIVSDYLHTYKIEDQYNPATLCHRAPFTSTTAEAINASLGPIEQEVLEAVEEGRKGFMGGWVSSVALDKLLTNLRKGHLVPLNKRKAMLESLGYTWHPYLTGGRTNGKSITIDDGKKPVLFILKDHPARVIVSPPDILRAYEAAQMGV